MSYLQSIQAAKEARERYEAGVIKLKEIVVEMEIMHNKFNGNYLEALQEFNKKFKKENEK